MHISSILTSNLRYQLNTATPVASTGTAGNLTYQPYTLNENIKSVDVKPSKRESLIDGDELYDDNVDDLLKIINI